MAHSERAIVRSESVLACSAFGAARCDRSNAHRQGDNAGSDCSIERSGSAIACQERYIAHQECDIASRLFERGSKTHHMAWREDDKVKPVLITAAENYGNPSTCRAIDRRDGVHRAVQEDKAMHRRKDAGDRDAAAMRGSFVWQR